MDFLLQIQEFTQGPIGDLLVHSGVDAPHITAAPAGDVELNGPEEVEIADQNFGSSFQDQNLGSSFEDQFLGSSFDGAQFGSSFEDQFLGSSFGDQFLGSSDIADLNFNVDAASAGGALGLLKPLLGLL